MSTRASRHARARTGQVLSGILQPLLLTTTASLAVALFDSVADGVPGKSASKALFQMHSLLGGALSLLLVFRTNSAYNRFWEARRIWENLLNRCPLPGEPVWSVSGSSSGRYTVW